MKKVIVYILTILAALLLGGVIGNFCAGLSALSWLNYVPPLHINTRNLNLLIATVTFGFQSKFNLAQLILTIVAIFVAPKICAFLDREK